MSWTSEFEFPPQGPQVASDTTPGDDHPEVESPEEDPQLSDNGAENPAEQATRDLADIPDEGPLDPSVFDGLFDDLLEPDDQPLAAARLDGISDEQTIKDNQDSDAEPDSDTEAASDPAPDDDVALEPIDEAADCASETADQNGAGVGAIDGEPIDTGEFGEQEQPDMSLGELDGAFTIGDLIVDEAPAVDEILDDEVFRPVDRDLDDDVDGPADDGSADDTDQAFDGSHPDGGGPDDPAPIAAPQLPSLDQSPSVLESSPSTENGHGSTTEPLLLQHEPVPSVATSPPIALDEHGGALNGAADAPIHFEVPAAEVVDRYHPPAYDAPAKMRRWPSFVTAVLVGGGLGIGGAIALIALQQPEAENDSSTTPVVVDNGVAQPATSDSEPTAGADGTDDGARDDTAGEIENVGPFLSADGSLVLNSIAFVPGTVELTAQSQQTLQQVADAAADLPPEPTILVVRTFSEATAQANRDLSISQAEALGQQLRNLGVEFGGLSVRGLGAAPLGLAMPVDNFVVVNPNLGAGDLKVSLDGIGPFEIGIDPDTLQLRPESLVTLDLVGVAMAAGQGTISLAGYSYDRPSDEANRAMARAAVDGAREYLATTHQIDPARISILAPGALPYVVGQEHGGHVSVRRGRAAAVEVAIHSGDSSVLSFAAGSDALSGAAAEELTRLAALLAEAQTEAVISVRSAGEASAEANLRLSELQAEAIGAFLLDAGLAEGQVRVYGVGDVTRQRSDTASSEVIVTVLG